MFLFENESSLTSSTELNFPDSQAFCATKAAELAAAFALPAVLAARTHDRTSSAADTAELAKEVCQFMSLVKRGKE